MMDIREKLNIKVQTPYWDDAYNMAVEQKEKPFWLEEEYFYRLEKDLNVLSNNTENVIQGLKDVLNDDDLLLFVKTLYNIIDLNVPLNELKNNLKVEFTPDKDQSLGHRLCLLYPILGHIEKAITSMKSKGISEEIIKITYSSIDGCISASEKKTGVLSFIITYFDWCILHVYEKLFNIGRFQFEIVDSDRNGFYGFLNDKDDIQFLAGNEKVHKSGHLLGAVGCDDPEGSFETTLTETDEFFEGYLVDKEKGIVLNKKVKLDKSIWKKIYTPGDSVIAIHIPGGSADFSKEACEKSYDAAREIFKNSYPQYNFKVFRTETWLLSAELKDILKPTSNILTFQSKFTLYPIKNFGTGVFFFAFDTVVNSLGEIDYEALPQKTSLHRAVKELYMNGGYIREYGGMFVL